MLSIKNYHAFNQYLDQFEDAYGKYLFDTVEDLLFQKWPDERSKLETRDALLCILMTRFDAFVTLNNINAALEWLASYRERHVFI